MSYKWIAAPTTYDLAVGDRLGLADRELSIKVEQDYTTYKDKVLYDVY